MGKKVRQEDVDLFAACSAGDASRVASLLAAGADPAYRDPTYGYAPLHEASEGGRSDCVRLLLDCPRSSSEGPDVRDEHDHTPLMLAAYHGRVAVGRMLLEAGADPRLGDKDGLTSVRVAEDEDWDELAELLRARAAAMTEEDLRRLAEEEEERAAEEMAAKCCEGANSCGGAKGLPASAEGGGEASPSDVVPDAASFNEAVYAALAAAVAPSEGGGGAGDDDAREGVSPDRAVLLEHLGMELAKVVMQIQGLASDDERRYVVAAAAKAARAIQS